MLTVRMKEGSLFHMILELYDIEIEQAVMTQREFEQHSEQREAEIEQSGFDWEPLHLREQNDLVRSVQAANQTLVDTSTYDSVLSYDNTLPYCAIGSIQDEKGFFLLRLLREIIYFYLVKYSST